MFKPLAAIGLALIGSAPIVLTPTVAMAQSSASTPTAMTPAEIAAAMDKKYPETAAARAHPVSGPVKGDVVYWPTPTSAKPKAGTAKDSMKANYAATKIKAKTKHSKKTART